MPAASPDPAVLADLRARVAAVAAQPGNARAVLPFGIEEVDRRLAGGGLGAAALHEAAGAGAEPGDEAAATLFLAAIAARLSAGGGQVLWALARRDLFAPSLALAGLGPERLIQAECRSGEEVLAVMEEGLRHGGLAAVVGEVGRASMAATRRLQLAAEEGNMAALLLRRRRRAGEDPLAAPSPAVTRWRIGCAPSAPLPVPGIGRPRWHVALVRQRGGEPCSWLLEAADETGCLALPAGPAHRPAAADGRDRRAA